MGFLGKCRTKEGEWFDVSMVKAKEKFWHPWQEPLEEVERLVKDFSQPGDQVVDPLGGAFTTAGACKRHDRKCISCDNNHPLQNRRILIGYYRQTPS